MSTFARDKILNTDLKSINKTFLEEMFASYHDRKTNTFHDANFDPTDEITLTSKEYKWVDGTVKTTLGTLVFNRYVLEDPGIIEHTRYWNLPITDKNLKHLNRIINDLVIVDTIPMTAKEKYVDNRDKLGFWCASFLSVSISAALIRPMPDVEKRKNELFEEHKEVLNSDNAVEQIMAVNKIEEELVGMVRNNLKRDSGYDLYASGVGNLDNNYKTINVMRGAVYNNTTQRYDIVKNSLMSGITKKDIPAFANSIVAAAYPSAVGTADAGYMAKIIVALLQSEHIDPNPESDCGTKTTIPLTITNQNKSYVIFRYVNINGKKEMLTYKNIDNYVGKTVQLYSPQCCMQTAICSKCAGQLFHKYGVTNIGPLLTQFTQKMLNLKLKSKHDLSRSAGIIKDEFVFLDKNSYCYIDKGNLKNKVTMKLFIPRLLEELAGFIRESTYISCMGLFPVKFYDKNNKVIFETEMTIPAMLSFYIYDDIQEDSDHYIVTYDPESIICSMAMERSPINVEFFINQIYLNSKTPQIPYNMMTEMMFRCLNMNGVDLTSASIAYELLARRLCRSGNDTFAKVFGKDPNIDQMSYKKQRFREAVQNAGALQGVLFQDISDSMNVGLAATLNGIEPQATPLEAIIRA